MEGSRRQAKYAIHALAAITKDDGLMSLSVLYKVCFNYIICLYVIIRCYTSKMIFGAVENVSFNVQRLVDMLEEKTHLPAVLQSLGCIAQTAMSVFETRESEIEEFIKRNILECSNVCLSKYVISAIYDLFMKFHLKHAFLFQKAEKQAKECWDDRSELCSLKVIFANCCIHIFFFIF